MADWHHQELERLGRRLDRIMPDLLRRKGAEDWDSFFAQMAFSELDTYFGHRATANSVARDFELVLPVLNELRNRSSWKQLLLDELGDHPYGSAVWTYENEWLHTTGVHLSTLAQVLMHFCTNAAHQRLVTQFTQQLEHEQHPDHYHPHVVGATVDRIITGHTTLPNVNIWLMLFKRHERVACERMLRRAIEALTKDADAAERTLLQAYHAHLYHAHVAPPTI